MDVNSKMSAPHLRVPSRSAFHWIDHAEPQLNQATPNARHASSRSGVTNYEFRPVLDTFYGTWIFRCLFCQFIQLPNVVIGYRQCVTNLWSKELLRAPLVLPLSLLSSTLSNIVWRVTPTERTWRDLRVAAARRVSVLQETRSNWYI